MNENLTCSTCLDQGASESLLVEDQNFSPVAKYYFCSVLCRNVFLNANKGHIKTKDYGDTTVKVSGM